MSQPPPEKMRSMSYGHYPPPTVVIPPIRVPPPPPPPGGIIEIYKDIKVKCAHCGKYGNIRSNCNSCGAPIDPE